MASYKFEIEIFPAFDKDTVPIVSEQHFLLAFFYSHINDTLGGIKVFLNKFFILKLKRNVFRFLNPI